MNFVSMENASKEREKVTENEDAEEEIQDIYRLGGRAIFSLHSPDIWRMEDEYTGLLPDVFGSCERHLWHRTRERSNEETS